MLVPILLASLCHVPTQDASSCRENCCTPPHTHTTSQVIYLKGPGGIEIHVKSRTTPFDTLAPELIDVDAIFRDKIDQTTYDLYLGCGGCVASEDALLNSSRVHLNGYKPGELEPFTQTRYFSVLDKASRKFNTSLLDPNLCTAQHFTIRLVDHMAESRADPIVWAAVVGLGERFTIQELLSFPIYILRNHGDVWSGLGYTYWLWLFVGAPLVVNGVREMLRCCRVAVLDPYPCCQRGRSIDPREPLYELALLGFTAAAFEELTHLVIAQSGIAMGSQFYIGLFLVVFFAQGSGILFVLVSWRGLRHRGKNWCTASAYWAPIEILTGFVFLFLLGSGFYIGPATVMLAGVLRLRELCRCKRQSVPSAPTERGRVDIETESGQKHQTSVRTAARGSSLGFLGK